MESSKAENCVGTKPLSHRRWFRFSLRTMLIVITVLVVTVGPWINHTKRQQKTIADIYRYKECSPYLSYENQIPGGSNYEGEITSVPPSASYKWRRSFKETQVPGWLLRSLGPDYFYNIEVIALDFTWFDPASDGPSAADQDCVIGYLQELPLLKTVMVTGSRPQKKFNADRLVQICSNLTKLEHLWINFPGHKLSPANIDQLNKLQNAKIRLSGIVADSDEDLSLIVELTQVKALDDIKIGDEVTLAGLQKLKSLAKLDTLGFMIANHPKAKEYLKYVKKEFKNASQVYTDMEKRF